MPLALLLPVAVVRLHARDLRAVGCGEGPWELAMPVKAIISVGVAIKGNLAVSYFLWIDIRLH